MGFSSMDDNEKANNTHQIEDQIMLISNMSNGQGLNLGVVNQYGQLMGDYSRLDDELWFGKNEDDESIKASNEGFQCDFVLADEKNVDPPKVSNLIDNPVCDGGLAVAKECSSPSKDSSMDQSQTSGPNSVENRKSYNLRNTVKRTRSKRRRPSKCNSRKGFQSFGTNSSATEQSPFQSETFVQSPLLDEIAEPVVRTKKIYDLLLSGSEEMKFKSNPKPKPISKRKHSTNNAKKCQHCETTKTPQWREGPLGRATLCNACGVQYRHNRLFPEYRPRGSPTFDAALHSSLPKKVQQMRRGKTTDDCAISGNSGLPA